MKTISLRVAGQILARDDVTALNLRCFKPESGSKDMIFLRFAFITRGAGDHIFPSFILDDWGREIRGLKLYEWVRDHGERFPRGEIFGYEQDGRETQCFLRELELYANLPTYAYKNNGQPITDGLMLSAILLAQEMVTIPLQVSKPAELKDPLRSALINWWQVPLSFGLNDLHYLKAQSNPGY